MNKTIVNKFTFDHFPSLEKQCHLFSEANDPLLMRERERLRGYRQNGNDDLVTPEVENHWSNQFIK